jgi:predicted RNA-binding Zn-ribbon protein involved in translation (DUF1610 family)
MVGHDHWDSHGCVFGIGDSGLELYALGIVPESLSWCFFYGLDILMKRNIGKANIDLFCRLLEKDFRDKISQLKNQTIYPVLTLNKPVYEMTVSVSAYEFETSVMELELEAHQRTIKELEGVIDKLRKQFNSHACPDCGIGVSLQDMGLITDSVDDNKGMHKYHCPCCGEQFVF